MPDNKTDDTETEEEHEPAQQHQDEETAPAEDQLSEDECDEAIAGLLADLESQRNEIQQLRAELAELRQQHSDHESQYEHTRKPDEPGSAADDGTPDERHWYFKRIKRG